MHNKIPRRAWSIIVEEVQQVADVPAHDEGGVIRVVNGVERRPVFILGGGFDHRAVAGDGQDAAAAEGLDIRRRGLYSPR